MANLLVVDPIDGTRAFLTGDPRWAVSIAYIHDGDPIAGVIYAPALGHLLGRDRLWGEARRRANPRYEKAALEGALVGGPRPMVGALAKEARVELAAAPRMPSLALRLAQVADGELDIGLACASANDWDVAGADIILSEAGALLTDVRGQILHYNRAEHAPRRSAGVWSNLAPPVIKAAHAAFGDRTA